MSGVFSYPGLGTVSVPVGSSGLEGAVVVVAKIVVVTKTGVVV